MKADTDLYAIFNKFTKKFVCFSIGKESLPENGSVLFKKIDIVGTINLAAYEWIGDYDTGHFVDKATQTYKVSELDIQKQMYDIFFRKYEPVYVLMNIVNTLLIQHEKDQLPWLDGSMLELSLIHI